ncbi:MAG: HPr family phosphocarrier protein [Elusimicrobia bacterium]|nr:HPr family phosphocarrier protein [Elusimicrobiota bacterium]
MIEPLVLNREFDLKWRFGLRTAMLVHRVAAAYSSSIELACRRLRADAKDLVSLACFGADQDATLSVSASGPDAEAALAALSDLFTAGERTVRCLHPDCACAPILVDATPRALEYSCAKLHLWTVERSTGVATVC